MQTSFMHPPFGFALFYLRSVAPTEAYIDPVTQQRIAPVTTGQIYWGAVPFVVIQLIMVALVIAFPTLVTGGLAQEAKVNPDSIELNAESGGYGDYADDGAAQPTRSPSGESGGNSADAPDAVPAADEDPAAALMREMAEDAAKKHQQK